jgi:oligosaccharide repeat unit polymerase
MKGEVRKYRALDLLNPSAFFIAVYAFYLVLVFALDALSGVIFGSDLIRFSVSRETVFVIGLYLASFFVAAYIIAPLVGRYRLQKFSLPPSLDLSRVKVWLVAMSLVVLGLLFHGIYFARIGFIPAFEDDAAVVRVQAKQGFGTIILLATGMLYAAFMLFSTIYQYGNVFAKCVILGLLSLSLLAVAGVGFRGPAAYLALVFFLSAYCQSRTYCARQRVSTRVVLYGLALIVALGAVDYLRYGKAFGLDAILQVGWMMTVNVLNLERIVEFFSFDTLMLGRTFLTDFAVALPGIESQFLGIRLVELFQLSFSGEGMTVTAPGEGYVNFGIIGVILHAVLLGVFCEFTNQSLRRTYRASSIALLVFLGSAVSKVSVAGIMPTLVFAVVPVLIFFIPAYLRCQKT